MLIVDASVAAKWVLPEPGSDEAAALRTQDSALIAPSLVAAEISNALWKSARRGDLQHESVGRMLQVAMGHFTRLIPIETLAMNALRLALKLQHPIYDCFYLALAERERAPLITADERLIRAARQAQTVDVRAL